MTLRETITAALPKRGPGRPPEIAGSAEAQAAMTAYQDARASLSRLTSEAEQLERQRQKKEHDLEQAALEPGDENYGRLNAELTKIVAALEKNERARRAANNRLTEARAQMQRASNAEVERALSRSLKKREKAAEGIQQGYAQVAAAFRDLIEANKSALAIFPGGIPPLGALLGASELRRALATEIYRQYPVAPIGGIATPSLPGADNGVALGDPTRLKSFAERIAEANAHFLDELKKAPAAMLVNEQSIEPAVAAEPAADVMRTAAEIQASMPASTRVTIDMRKGGGNA